MTGRQKRALPQKVSQNSRPGALEACGYPLPASKGVPGVLLLCN
jgi:hypothetical protein